jgi:two-component system sensor histidine kinase PilS (NtrC family)
MTEVRRLEEQARLNEKLSAVGGMAAQMAHEIRNPLGAISAAAKLMAGQEEFSPDSTQLLGIIAKESQRLSKTVDTYLRDLRSAENVAATCDLVVSIKETARLLRLGPEASHLHVLDIDSPPAPVLIQMSSDELSQVLWNLGRNALEAMPQGGRVTFRVRVLEGAATTEVEDEGSGFDQRRLKKLFEPLQTTKAAGTGLGLAIAHRLVRQRGGELSVSSNVGRGARVVFSVPLANAQSAA